MEEPKVNLQYRIVFIAGIKPNSESCTNIAADEGGAI